MKNWLIGTGLVIGGGITTLILFSLGVPHKTAAIVGVSVATGGFIIQMVSAFRIKSSFDRQEKLVQKEFEETVRKARELPLEKAIELLLKHIN